MLNNNGVNNGHVTCKQTLKLKFFSCFQLVNATQKQKARHLKSHVLYGAFNLNKRQILSIRIITVHNCSCGKVMFLHQSVSYSVRGGCTPLRQTHLPNLD